MPNLVRLTVELVPPRFKRWWRHAIGYVSPASATARESLWAIPETRDLLRLPTLGRSVVVPYDVAFLFMERAGLLPGWDEDEDPKPILWEDGADVPENDPDDGEND